MRATPLVFGPIPMPHGRPRSGADRVPCASLVPLGSGSPLREPVRGGKWRSGRIVPPRTRPRRHQNRGIMRKPSSASEVQARTILPERQNRDPAGPPRSISLVEVHRGGAGGARGAVRGGIVSESVAKASRAGIGREKKRGISTILFRCFGGIRAFATDSDNRCRRGSPGGAPRVGRRPRREPPAPRRALRTRECSSNRCSRRQNARLEGKMHISTRKGPAAVVADRGAGPVPEHLQ